MEEENRELEEVMREMEILKEEHRAKAVALASLKRSHDDLLSKLQEAKAATELREREIGAKDEELAFAERIYGELKNDFDQKELSLKNLGLANVELKGSFKEKLAKLEAENTRLVSASRDDESKLEDQGRMISAYMEEIDTLRGLLLRSEDKCREAEKRAQAPQEIRRREELLLQAEKDRSKVEDQLKWKKEQFRHLEEAHGKVQDEFRDARKEWRLERADMVAEISSLQTELNSQTRAAGDLRARLEMCNQALAHEESQRKLLEIQVSETKALYENVVVEFDEARSNFSSVMVGRDNEVSRLRSLLVSREAQVKELEIRNTQLEMEEKDLRESLGEFQNAEIDRAEVSASFKALRRKFKQLDLAHSSCSDKLKQRANEWNVEKNKLVGELDKCFFRLNSNEMELRNSEINATESFHLLIREKGENEERAVENLVLKSKLLELAVFLEKSTMEMEIQDVQAKERVALLIEKLEKKNDVLAQAQAEIRMENEAVQTLQAKIEYLETVELEDRVSTRKELNRYKSMAEELQRNLDFFKEKARRKENDLQDQLQKCADALDGANSSLGEKTMELERCRGMLESSAGLVRLMEQASRREADLLGDLAKASDALHQSNAALIQEKTELERAESRLELMKATLKHLENQKTALEAIAMRNDGEIAMLRSELEQQKETLRRELEEKDKTIEELERSVATMEVGKQSLCQQKLPVGFDNSIERMLEARVANELDIQFKSSMLSEALDELGVLELELRLEKKEKLLAEEELASLRRRHGSEREEWAERFSDLHGFVEKAAAEEEALAGMMKRLAQGAHERIAEDFAPPPPSPAGSKVLQHQERRQPLKECNR